MLLRIKTRTGVANQVEVRVEVVFLVCEMPPCECDTVLQIQNKVDLSWERTYSASRSVIMCCEIQGQRDGCAIETKPGNLQGFLSTEQLLSLPTVMFSPDP